MPREINSFAGWDLKVSLKIEMFKDKLKIWSKLERKIL
jgi:hypothetical protein